MIISRGRRYIFVHIPKTGGTALTLALEDRAKADDILIGDTPKAVRRRGRLKGAQTAGRLWKHSGLADVIELISEDEARSMFCFTIVRNPWDRMVSYYHWLRDQSFAHPAVTLAKSLEFSGFLNASHTRTSIGGAPYSSYMRLASGEECCNAYLRLEHLDEDAAPLEAHLGFRVTPLQRANVSDRARDWRGYYSDADARLVETLCAEDIARFNYSF
ncbi:sulfotransferase family 2 domain-containing protein [Thioclava sp. A2]|uniref:sulfotransferase family 2 domain-containing protein n=1 Tax=Thioclava sp. FCG-A2 TaxID=3080562 RepID=UPI0029557DC7|nr:sulfotransferase family 2 domain-containing protein [Thioclava sp. A2]MDV7271766.1 sulfotransferase family 2 domain-containing protein [Thioclava sp. A2]